MFAGDYLPNHVNMRSIKDTLPVKHVKRMDQQWTYQKAVPTWLP